MKKLTAVIIGAGNRGKKYTDLMASMPEKYEIVGVAEPIDDRRNYVKEKYNLPDYRCFTDWKPLFELGKIADIAVIATMDRGHYAPAMKAISLGYHLLLEKPVSPEPSECLDIAEAAEEKGVKVLVCHVLRYAPAFVITKRVIQSGRIGRVVSVNHEECVGNVHQSHSFVRGNWGNSKRSSFMLLQKSCHDVDILQWMLGKKCLKVQSFGSLSYFTEENAPKGAPERCIDGCPAAATCPYNAVKLYLDDKKNDWFRCAATAKTTPTDEDVIDALRNTNYGRCVFRCDNDVVDHQTVSLLYEDGITATFTMNAFNKGGRFTHVMGTKGELHLDAQNNVLKVYDFETKTEEQIPVVAPDGSPTSGHGGGDRGIIESLYDYLADGLMGEGVSEIGISCENHITVFAAEASRRAGGQMISIEEYKKSL